jgi:ribosomal protein S18 acetylase RimI-like enzyme
MSAEDLEWRIEALCIAARPALVREIVDGWAMGRSGGRTRQANCVNPMRGQRGNAVAAISRGETFYEACGQTPLFRVPTIADEMGAELDRLGYGVEGQTITLFNPLEMPTTENAGTVLLAAPDEPWFAARARFSGDTAQNDAAYRKMVESIALRKMFAATHLGDRIASIAYGGVGDGLLVLESVATDAEFRGQGLARKTLQTLIAWSRSLGAQAACLQVEAENAPARALYASLGFGRRLYHYHYRRRTA